MNLQKTLGIAFLAATFALTGCSSSGPTAQESLESVSPPAASASEPAALIALGTQPKVGECFNQEKLSDLTQEDPSVDCVSTHTERTIAVIDLPEDYGNPHELEAIDNELEAVDAAKNETEFQQLKIRQYENATNSANINPHRECRGLVNEEVGADTYQAVLPYSIDVTFPDKSQWSEGQRWARCNIVKLNLMDDFGLEALPAVLPGKTQYSIENSICLRNGKYLACRDLKKSKLDKNWVWFIDSMPKPETAVDAKNNQESDRMAEDACIAAIPVSIDRDGLGREDVYAPMGSRNASLAWWKANVESPDGSGKQHLWWNADDTTISCYVSAWRVPGYESVS